MSRSTCVLICSFDLAMLLGAILPETAEHHRQLRKAGHMMIRDRHGYSVTFWPRVDSRESTINRGSSQ